MRHKVNLLAEYCWLETGSLAQQYKVRIKGKVEQSRERSSVLSHTSV